jgi:hypothetical protein
MTGTTDDVVDVAVRDDVADDVVCTTSAQARWDQSDVDTWQFVGK